MIFIVILVKLIPLLCRVVKFTFQETNETTNVTFYLVKNIGASYSDSYWSMSQHLSKLQLEIFENDGKMTGIADVAPNSKEYSCAFTKLISLKPSEQFYMLLDNPESMDGL